MFTRLSALILILVTLAPYARADKRVAPRNSRIQFCEKALTEISTNDGRTSSRQQGAVAPSANVAPLGVPWVGGPKPFFDSPAPYTYVPIGYRLGDRFLIESGFYGEELSGERGPEVIDVANPRFERNKWSHFPEWMAGRRKIAEKYKDRSRYFIINSGEPGKPLDPNKVPTTVGVTWSKFKRHEIEGKSKEALLADPTIILPEEETLATPVTRYFDSSAQGIAIEFRANSKALHAPEIVAPEMLTQMVQMAMQLARDYPELYDKPIITAYADREHLRLYRKQYGMEIQAETTPPDRPIVVTNENGEKIEWWVIQVTPRRWEANLFKLANKRDVSSMGALNQPLPFLLANGAKAFAKAMTRINFDEEGRPTEATLNQPVELAPGIWGAADATVKWENGNLVSISAISKAALLEISSGTIKAPAGSSLSFDNSLNYIDSPRVHRPMYFQGGRTWYGTPELEDLLQLVKKDSKGQPVVTDIQFPGKKRRIHIEPETGEVTKY